MFDDFDEYDLDGNEVDESKYLAHYCETSKFPNLSFADFPIIRDVPLYSQQQRQISPSQSAHSRANGKTAIRISRVMFLSR